MTAALLQLKQGLGRLIRSRQDRGVLAVLDSRLATNRSYRWDLINALPPMSRTKDVYGFKPGEIRYFVELYLVDPTAALEYVPGTMEH